MMAVNFGSSCVGNRKRPQLIASEKSIGYFVRVKMLANVALVNSHTFCQGIVIAVGTAMASQTASGESVSTSA